MAVVVGVALVSFGVFAATTSPGALLQMRAPSAGPVALTPVVLPRAGGSFAGRIAFLAGSPPGGVLGKGDVYVLDGSGRPAVRLTHLNGKLGKPTWSPGGGSLVFPLGRTVFRPWNLYALSVANGRLTQISGADAFDQNPVWSPDGTMIAFASDRPGNPNYEIYSMSADGQNVRRLTFDPGFDTEPTWSPDGSRIAFVSSRAGRVGRDNWEIFTMSADGSGSKRLTHDDFFDHDPAWSPDGSRIAFAVNRGRGDHRIMVMDADGSSLATVFACSNSCSSIEGGPAWSPDGSMMAFAVEMKDGLGAVKQRIDVMDANGHNLLQLDTGPLDVCCPAWGMPATSSGQ